MKDLKAFKAFCWDYVVRRGYLSEPKIKEAREFAEAATKREG